MDNERQQEGMSGDGGMASKTPDMFPFVTRPWCARRCNSGTPAQFVGHVLSIKLLTICRLVWYNVIKR